MRYPEANSADRNLIKHSLRYDDPVEEVASSSRSQGAARYTSGLLLMPMVTRYPATPPPDRILPPPIIVGGSQVASPPGPAKSDLFWVDDLKAFADRNVTERLVGPHEKVGEPSRAKPYRD
jgi:hypothetical protein